METDDEITVLKYHARIFKGIICIWICYAQASTIINGASLKNKHDFLITPGRRAG